MYLYYLINRAYIYTYIHTNRIWYEIAYKGWYAIKHNQTKPNKED